VVLVLVLCCCFFFPLFLKLDFFSTCFLRVFVFRESLSLFSHALDQRPMMHCLDICFRMFRLRDCDGFQSTAHASPVLIYNIYYMMVKLSFILYSRANMGNLILMQRWLTMTSKSKLLPFFFSFLFCRTSVIDIFYHSRFYLWPISRVMRNCRRSFRITACFFDWIAVFIMTDLLHVFYHVCYCPLFRAWY
jgi:hypothetical protein